MTETSEAPARVYQIRTLFDDVSSLKGQTLETLKRKKKFTVLDTYKKIIFIRVESTGIERNINFDKEIKPAYLKLRREKRLTRKEIEENFAPRNSAFVAAILSNLKGVRKTEKPVITLFYQRVV